MLWDIFIYAVLTENKVRTACILCLLLWLTLKDTCCLMITMTLTLKGSVLPNIQVQNLQYFIYFIRYVFSAVTSKKNANAPALGRSVPQ